jgi:hypothetical protein
MVATVKDDYVAQNYLARGVVLYMCLPDSLYINWHRVGSSWVGVKPLAYRDARGFLFLGDTITTITMRILLNRNYYFFINNKIIEDIVVIVVKRIFKGISHLLS